MLLELKEKKPLFKNKMIVWKMEKSFNRRFCNVRKSYI